MPVLQESDLASGREGSGASVLHPLDRADGVENVYSM